MFGFEGAGLRYEKTVCSFPGVLCLAAALDWLKP